MVIGSGATAVTLAPALARADAPGNNASALSQLRRCLAVRQVATLARPFTAPARGVSAFLRRIRIHPWTASFWEYCRRRPAQATELLRGAVAERFGWPVVEQHFTPRYRPWDQRLCVAPDGDLFSAIEAGTVTVVTDQIDHFLSDGSATVTFWPEVAGRCHRQRDGTRASTRRRHRSASR